MSPCSNVSSACARRFLDNDKSSICFASALIAFKRKSKIVLILGHIESSLFGGSPEPELRSIGGEEVGNLTTVSFLPVNSCKGDIPVLIDGDKFRAKQVNAIISVRVHPIGFSRV